MSQTSLLSFIAGSILLGAGLAMDAFSVSVANGLNEPGMRKRRMACIAGVYAFFQFLMPLVGWLCIHTIAARFRAFQVCIPWIAFLLLGFIGGKMLLEAIQTDGKENPAEGPSGRRLSTLTLLMQGIATSIDALSVGFTIADYHAPAALVCSGIIAAVTFCLCMIGLLFGRSFGERFSGKATFAGGLILICIGLQILIRGLLRL